MKVAELIAILQTLPQDAIVVAHSADADFAEVGMNGVDLFRSGSHDLLHAFLFDKDAYNEDADYVLINGWPYRVS